MAEAPGELEDADKAAMVSWLFANSHELLFALNPDGALSLTNPAWRAATGWSEEALAGRLAADLLHPDDRPALAAALAGQGRETAGELLVRIAHQDGDWRWFDLRLQSSQDGRVIGIATDASKARERAAELDDARRTRSLLSEAAGVGS